MFKVIYRAIGASEYLAAQFDTLELAFAFEAAVRRRHSEAFVETAWNKMPA